MNQKISSADVARKARVSQATVSYVLNQRSDQTIRAETRQRVLEAARELGYRPNQAARTLVTGKTQTAALWVPYSYRSVFSHIIEQVMHLARRHQYHVIVMQVNQETADSLAAAGFLNQANVDGILAWDCSGMIEDILDRYPGIGPIISLGPAYTECTDHVGVDLYGGAYQAVSHLLEIGCRRIAYAGYEAAMFAEEPRYAAYVKTIKDAGREIELIPLKFGEVEDSYQGIQHYVEEHGYPDGLFCWNDESAIGANRALAEIGVCVPKEVAVIGCDGIWETAYSLPAISTVVQPFHETCRIGWEFLQQRLLEPNLPIQRAVLPMRLERRASTGRMPNNK